MILPFSSALITQLAALLIVLIKTGLHYCQLYEFANIAHAVGFSRASFSSVRLPYHDPI